MKKSKWIALAGGISMMLTVPVLAGEPYDYQNDHFVWNDVNHPNQWIQEDNGDWWFQFGDGTYARDDWYLMADGFWYHFDQQGWMQTGWILDEGTWYYLAADGAMQTGWILDGGSWYYLAENGAMQTGWILDGGSWYYLEEDGAMQTDFWILTGNRAPYTPIYYVDSDGRWIPDAIYEGTEGQWMKDSVGWWFRYTDGTYPKGDFEKVEGKYYFFDNDGYMVTDLMQDLDTGYWHYFYEDGSMAQNTEAAGYYFDEYGIAQ